MSFMPGIKIQCYLPSEIAPLCDFNWWTNKSFPSDAKPANISTVSEKKIYIRLDYFGLISLNFYLVSCKTSGEAGLDAVIIWLCLLPKGWVYMAYGKNYVFVIFHF